MHKEISVKAKFRIKELNVFPPEREEKLRRIERFSMFDIFVYRSTLWDHSRRVSAIVEEISPIAQKVLANYDPEKARILGLVHDDAEVITGDVQLGHKQAMNSEQLTKTEKSEADAIEQLADIYPLEIGGYNYRELLYHALRKDCVEAHVVSYADKLDAFCESLHELFGGNTLALRAVLNYTIILGKFGEKFTDLRPMFTHNSVPLLNIELRTDSWRVHESFYKHLNQPHTEESIRQKTEFPVYDHWKEIILNRFGEEGIMMLTSRK